VAGRCGFPRLKAGHSSSCVQAVGSRRGVLGVARVWTPNSEGVGALLRSATGRNGVHAPGADGRIEAMKDHA